MRMLVKSKSLVLLISQSNASLAVQKRMIHSASLSKIAVRRVREVRHVRPVVCLSSGSRAANSYQIRYVSSTPQAPSKPTSNSSSNQQGGQQSSKFTNGINYTFAIAIGTVAGLITGYILVTDANQFNDVNELSRSLMQGPLFESTKLVENTNSTYHNFPLKLHLYQYESCPYCCQVRAYLDYFGFSYKLTEVDSYSKEEITKFTKARILPILVIEDKHTKKRWHLANATSILSALESVRNDKPIHYPQILDQYLPILKGNVVYNTLNPFKYHISNSDLNSIEWRKWINNYAIPAFKINSMSTVKDLFETYDFIALTSRWRDRYGPLKYNYVYYNHAFKAYNSYSGLLSQLDAKGERRPREILHMIIDKWEDGLGEKNFIDGDKYPSIADISMYGNVKAYEGCALFREAIAKHPIFRAWYERMKATVVHGHKEAQYEQTRSKFFFLQSVSDEDVAQVAESDMLAKQDEQKRTKLKSKTRTIESKEEPDSLAKLAATSDVSSNELTTNSKNLSELFIFRVLTLNYLAHLVVFTYAAYMK